MRDAKRPARGHQEAFESFDACLPAAGLESNGDGDLEDVGKPLVRPWLVRPVSGCTEAGGRRIVSPGGGCMLSPIFAV